MIAIIIRNRGDDDDVQPNEIGMSNFVKSNTKFFDVSS